MNNDEERWGSLRSPQPTFSVFPHRRRVGQNFIIGLLLAFLSATAHAGEWMSCANKTHSIDLLVEPEQKQVLGFALSIHGEKQDAISWDILAGTLDPRTQTLNLTARERSTAPREFTLSVQESSGRFTLRGARGETVQDLSCFWGTIGG